MDGCAAMIVKNTPIMSLACFITWEALCCDYPYAAVHDLNSQVLYNKGHTVLTYSPLPLYLYLYSVILQTQNTALVTTNQRTAVLALGNTKHCFFVRHMDILTTECVHPVRETHYSGLYCIRTLQTSFRIE